ncbi:MAG: hypothetical protein COA58_00025 [Bacteroidetes bacterium]|nr:MAG: hypothetical protein COA58_00025 [Bacteroidota bacterium]
MRKKLFLAFICISFIGLAQEIEHLTDLSEARKISRTVAGLFQDNKVADAVDVMKPYWPLPENEIEAFEEKTMKYLNFYVEKFGLAKSFLKINNQTISDIYVRETYLVNFSMTSIRLKFTYYKNEDGWIINSFEWDTEIGEEFQP